VDLGRTTSKIGMSGSAAYNALGQVSQLAEETHIPIGPASFDQIMYVFGLIGQGR
jgi:hypothetical protein